MALQNPGNLYTGGAVVFNTQPSTNFALQLMAQKKAKDEALDEYYRKLPQTINEAGMRDQDRPGFMQRVSEMQAFYGQHRDAIKDPRRDGGAAQYNFEKMVRDIRGYTDTSRTEGKKSLEFAKLWANKDNAYLFRNKKFMDGVAAHDRALDDPERASFDPYRLPPPPRPLTLEDQQKIDRLLTDKLEAGKVPTGKVEALPGFTTRTHFLKQYSPQNLGVIADRAKSIYDTNYDVQGDVDARYEEALKNPELLAAYNQAFQSVKKEPIRDADDFFAAEKIIAFAQATPGYEDEKDTWAEWKAKNAITSAQADARQARSDAKKGASTTATPTFNDIFRAIDEAATNLRDAYAAGEARTNRLDLSSLPTEQQEEVLKKARNLAADDLLLPDDIVLIKGVDGRLGIYDSKSGTRKGYLTPTGTNIPAQFSVKEKREAMKNDGKGQTSPTPKPAGKVISKDAFRKMSVTERQQFLANGGTYK